MRHRLSDREQQVLEYAAQGFTDDMIAQKLGIERGTVNSYWVRIRGKLGHLSRTHLVANYVQANADTKEEASRVINMGIADNLAKVSFDILENERADRRMEREHSADATAKLKRDHKEVLDKANAEIERLRELLKKKNSK